MSDKAIELDVMREIAAQFSIEGAVVKAEPYGSGHINDTYAVYYKGAPHDRYIYQRMNTKIFTNPDQLMENIVRVTDHIRAKAIAAKVEDLDRATLTVIRTRSGGLYHRTPSNDCWRAYIFIEGASTYDVLKKKSHAYEAAKTFGEFQGLLADLPGAPLHDIIPYFHHTPRRMTALRQAMDRNVAMRKAAAAAEIKFALDRIGMTSTIVDAMASKKLPLRVTHNDTKINNVMIDDETDTGVCVIDLDSVMPGSALYDFGDMVRTAAATSLEDEVDLSKAGISMEMFEELVRGYTTSARGFLVKQELDMMAFSARLITFMIGIRFLTDYLSGDTYFKIKHPHHNIERCRVQFKMVEMMEKKSKEMEAIVAKFKRG